MQPWTNLSAWDPVMAVLASAIRNNTTPSYLGGLHPRLKSPLGHRLAQSFINLFMGGSAPFTGPTIVGCSLDAANSTLTVAYNVTLLRGESVLVRPFAANLSAWGTRDSSSFMLCFSTTGGEDCIADDEEHLDLWVPAGAVAGSDGTSAVLTVSPSPIVGGILSALRYGWTLSNEGDTCCPHLNVTLGYEVCIPGNCPVKSSRSFLPGNPFYANITAAGTCACLYPQICDFQPSSASSSASMSRSPPISPTLTTSPSSSSTASSIATASRTSSQFGEAQSPSQIPASQTTSQVAVTTPTQSQSLTRSVSQSILITTQSQSSSVTKSTDPIIFPNAVVFNVVVASYADTIDHI